MQVVFINLQNETINFQVESISLNLQISILEVDNLDHITLQNNPASLDDGTAHAAMILQSKNLTAESCKHRPNVNKLLKTQVLNGKELTA